jgi:hypothetical protein
MLSKAPQKFLIEIYHANPISEIDVAIALKKLPLNVSRASFKVKKAR